MRINTLARFGITFSTFFSISAQGSEWTAGSVVLNLEGKGIKRVFTYKDALPDLGIAAGTVFFEGERPLNSNIYKGVAYVFRKECKPFPFYVTGEVTDDRSIVLKGIAPIRDQNCAVKSYADREFTLTYSNAGATTSAQSVASAPTAPTAPATSTVVVPLQAAAVKHIDLLTSSNREYRTPAQHVYDVCSRDWNEERWMSRPDGKALVAGRRKTKTGHSAACYWTYGYDSNAEALARATELCKAKHSSCFDFAVGASLSDWAKEQQESIRDRSRERMQHAAADKARREEEDDDDNSAGVAVINGLSQGLQNIMRNRSGGSGGGSASRGGGGACIPQPCRGNMECCPR